MIFACMMASPAFAIQVEFVPDYNIYGTGFLSSITGRQIDLSTAGVTFVLGSPFVGFASTSLNETRMSFDSPDGTTNSWWVYVRMINDSSVSVSNPEGFMFPPPNIRFTIDCPSSYVTYNITSTLPNSTWNTDYTLFYITNDQSATPYAIPSVSGNSLSSPTGRDLYVKSSDCRFEVYPVDWGYDSDLSVYVSVWNENPDRNAVCNIDPAVASIQSTTLGIVDINFQIWSMLFNIFSIVVILLAIFGIPILLIKLIRWIFDEAKKMTGKRKVF
jgi:hypothetical protein